jgi:hypothetical protein
MSSKDKYAFRSYIKDIFLEVPDYKYNHKPHSGSKRNLSDDDKKNNHIFIGREKLKANFLNILKEGGRNGAYLVTGYRGMGKTSLVNNVIDEYKDFEEKENREVKPIKVSLAQAKLEEIDVLRHILRVLYDEIRVDRNKHFFPSLEYNTLFFALLFFSILSIFYTLIIPNGTTLTILRPKNIFDYFDFKILGIAVAITALIFVVIHNILKLAIQFYIQLNAKTYNTLRGKYIKRYKSILKSKAGRTLIFLSIIYLISLVVYFILYKAGPSGTFLDNLLNHIFSLRFVVFFLIGEIGIILLIYIFINFNRIYEIYNLFEKISQLYDRSSSSVTQASGESTLVKDIILSFTRKQSKVYPIASAKEIEYELISILQAYSYKKFIFIFDELDKVEMDLDKGIYENTPFDESERTYLNDLRERKQIIIKVLSSLKHLLTEAEARFIFIAGREMFDASLADISDRQSALGSIFHYTFYVESFLKETKIVNHAQKNNANNLVEEYLKNILVKNTSDQNKFTNAINEDKNKFFVSENEPFLFQYWQLLKQLKSGIRLTTLSSSSPIDSDQDIIKILFTLENFIAYLQYRSNGSPKKLVKLIEENFVMGSSIANRFSELSSSDITGLKNHTIGLYTNETSIFVLNSAKSFENKTFINFAFRQQYKFGFNSYLFYPFISVQKNILENYSDSVNVSTPYLMDSIIKFHPFAFSNYNLELLPELLSTNKTPELRYFVQELIDFLGQNHIRETDSGLFRYKFFDKTHNEIAYISRISDEESAAFNFSLDESYAIKNHIAYKIKFLRSTFKDFKKKDNASFESLLFLNDLLGDSQLFDESYKDAIVSLSDALHDVKPPEQGSTFEYFLTWMRVKLKLSMIFDKMKYYEMAIGHLGLAMVVSTTYLSDNKILKLDSAGGVQGDKQKGNDIQNEESKVVTSVDAISTTVSTDKLIIGLDPVIKGEAINTRNNNEIVSVSDQSGKIDTPLYRELLQVSQHAILGCIYVQEKFAEGITFAKLENYLLQYSKVHQHNSYKEYQGRDMMMASFYGNLGTILYYKNKTLPYRTTLKMIEILRSEEGGPNYSNTEKEKLAKVCDLICKTPVFRIGNNESEKNIELSFYIYVYPSYKELLGTFDFASQEFRFSFITYIAYKKSLATYLAIDLEEKQSDFQNYYELEVLINSATSILKKYRNVHGAKKLMSLANSINKISDLLLSLYVPNDDSPYFIFEQVISKYRSADSFARARIETDELFLDEFIFSSNDKLIEKTERTELSETTISNTTKYKKSINLSYLLQLYYLAGRLYAKAGRSVAYNFQLKKILLTIHRSGSLETRKAKENISLINSFLEETVVKKILELASTASSSSDRSQLATLKYYTGLPDIALPSEITRVFYQNIATNPESKEAIILFSLIKLKESNSIITDSTFEDSLKRIPSLNFIGPYNSISHQSIRIMELDLQVKINRSLLDKVINSKLSYRNDKNFVTLTSKFSEKLEKIRIFSWEKHLHKHTFKLRFPLNKGELFGELQQGEYSDQKENELLEEELFSVFIDFLCQPKKDSKEEMDFNKNFEYYTQLITNSIFCLHQSILTCNIYGVNYMQGPAYIGKFHRKMGDWVKHLNLCKILKAYLRNVKNSQLQEILTQMDLNIETLVGKVALRNIDDYMSHYQMAKEYYINSIQLHSEGPSYKHQLSNMIYLEDDYGDNLNHFGAALERQLINSGHTQAVLNNLEDELSISKLYRYNNYINHITGFNEV